MIRALTFDLWNTLIQDIDYSEQRIAILLQVCEQQQCYRHVTAIRAAYGSAMRLWDECWRVKRKGISIYELIGHIFNTLNIHAQHPIQERVVIRFAEVVINDPPPMLDYASSVLEVLHTKYRIGLICDTGFTSGQVLRKVLKKHAMLDFFSCLLFSDEVGATKPNALIYQRALDALELDPGEVAHVGNLLETDVVGAKAIGMQAIWLKRGEGEDPARISYRPDHEIKHLHELLHML